MQLRTRKFFKIIGIILLLTEQANGGNVYCPSMGQTQQQDYFITINCPWLSSSSRVLIEHQQTNQCSNFNSTSLVVIFPFIFDTILKNFLGYPSILASFPSSCEEKLVYVKVMIYQITGIHKSFRFSALEPQVDLLFTQYFHLRLLENDHEKANCSNDNDVAIFKVKGVMVVAFDLGVKYDEDICEQIFNKAKIKMLKLKDIIDSVIKRNVLGFQQTAAVKDLQSQIYSFDLTGYGLRLDQSLFAIKVFSKTTKMRVEGTLEQIDPRILISSNLEEIKIFAWHMKKFLHNNLDWLDFANERSSNNTLKIILNGANLRPSSETLDYIYHRVTTQYDKLYQLDPDYADLFKDNTSFCLFYRLKQKNLNVRLNGFIFEVEAQHHCDCTLYWLYLTFMGTLEDILVYAYLVECDRLWNDLQRECDIPAMAARCELQTIQQISEPNGYTFVWKIKFTEFVLNTVMASAINCFAVLLNAFVVFVFRRMWASEEFRKKKLTDKNQPMWDYIYYNTFFVLLQALIFALEPLTACIEYDGIYCSPFILTRFAQAFYLFGQSYLANVFKLMANVTNTLFVFYRFGINSDRLAKFRKAKPVGLVTIFLVPALVISAITVFVNERFDLKVLSEDQFNYLFRDRYKTWLPSSVLYALYLLNMVLGSVVFTVINLSVDMRLLFFLRSFQQSNRKEEAENRVTKMIVLNGLFSFLSRMPEMAVSILYLAFSFNPLIFPACVFKAETTHSICPSLSKISRFFFSFSFFENFILLYLYNPEFKKLARSSLEILFQDVKAKLRLVPPLTAE
nr:G protein-coupled receptor [Proales similis]